MDYLIIALIVVYAVFMAISSLVALYVIGTMLFDLLKPSNDRRT